MSVVDALIERAAIYRAWQAPFAERKLAPVLRHNDLNAVRRVLDVGCGPGTNAQHFGHTAYLGMDINPAYIESARRRHRGEFLVADVTQYEVGDAERFDFVLINSFLHHIDTGSVQQILGRVRRLLSPDGRVHILELVLPSGPSIARALAHWDRGRFARPLAEWQRLFEESFIPEVLEPYPLGLAGVTFWNMVYFKGRARQ